MMARDRNAQLRNIIAGYGDSIRLSDIKANIAVLFVAIMMGVALQFRDFYPWYLSTPVMLAPFMLIFIEPAHLRLSAVSARRTASGFRSGASRIRTTSISSPTRRPSNLDELPARCALLSRILWWKNRHLAGRLYVCRP